jgi:hypothetical protein
MMVFSVEKVVAARRSRHFDQPVHTMLESGTVNGRCTIFERGFHAR